MARSKEGRGRGSDGNLRTHCFMYSRSVGFLRIYVYCRKTLVCLKKLLVRKMEHVKKSCSNTGNTQKEGKLNLNFRKKGTDFYRAPLNPPKIVCVHLT